MPTTITQPHPSWIPRTIQAEYDIFSPATWSTQAEADLLPPSPPTDLTDATSSDSGRPGLFGRRPLPKLTRLQVSVSSSRREWNDEDLFCCRTDLNLEAHQVTQVPDVVYDRIRHTGLRITAEITRVLLGTWYGRPATFISFLVSHDDAATVPGTKIRAVVSPYIPNPVAPIVKDQANTAVATTGLESSSPSSTNGLQAPPPVIVRFSPNQLFGIIKTIDSTHTHSIEGNVGTPSTLPVNEGLTIGSSTTTTFQQDVRQWIKCSTKSKPGQSGHTVFELEARENTVQGEGVPRELPVGLIVTSIGGCGGSDGSDSSQRGDQAPSFSLAIEVESRQRIWSRVFPLLAASPFGYANPAVFDGMSEWRKDGDEEVGREMEKWDEGVWKMLVRYRGEYEDVVVGE